MQTATQTKYTVKTNYGWGWRVPQAPECPHFGSQAEAARYAALRNAGIDHMPAWKDATSSSPEELTLDVNDLARDDALLALLHAAKLVLQQPIDGRNPARVWAREALARAVAQAEAL